MNMSYVHVTLIFDPHTIKCERSKSLAFYHRISCFINSKIFFFFIRILFFGPRLDVLIFWPILG